MDITYCNGREQLSLRSTLKKAEPKAPRKFSWMKNTCSRRVRTSSAWQIIDENFHISEELQCAGKRRKFSTFDTCCYQFFQSSMQHSCYPDISSKFSKLNSNWERSLRSCISLGDAKLELRKSLLPCYPRQKSVGRRRVSFSYLSLSPCWKKRFT